MLQYVQWITGTRAFGGNSQTTVTVISKSQPRHFDPSIPSCSLSLSGGAKTKDGSVVTWSSKNFPPIFFLRCGYPKVGGGKMDGSLTSELMVVTLRSSKSTWKFGIWYVKDGQRLPDFHKYEVTSPFFSGSPGSKPLSSLWSQGAKSQATSSVAQRSSIPPGGIHPPNRILDFPPPNKKIDSFHWSSDTECLRISSAKKVPKTSIVRVFQLPGDFWILTVQLTLSFRILSFIPCVPRPSQAWHHSASQTPSGLSCQTWSVVLNMFQNGSKTVQPAWNPAVFIVSEDVWSNFWLYNTLLTLPA